MGAARSGILLRVRGGRRVGHSERCCAVERQGYRWAVGVLLLEAGVCSPIHFGPTQQLADHVGVSGRRRLKLNGDISASLFTAATTMTFQSEYTDETTIRVDESLKRRL